MELANKVSVPDLDPLPNQNLVKIG